MDPRLDPPSGPRLGLLLETMFFRKKRAKRLYYPVKSRWYTRPRRRSSVKRSNRLFKTGLGGIFKDLVKRSLFLVTTGGIFIILVLFLLFSSYFSIMNIEVIRENFNIDSAAIENELNQIIGKNILFFPKSRIHNTIQTRFPEFDGIEIRKVLPSAIKIGLKSHPIVANLRAYYVLPKAEESIGDDFTELNKVIEELTESDPKLVQLKKNPLNDQKLTDTIFDLNDEADAPEPIEQKSLLNRIGQAIFDQEENLELMTFTIPDLTQPIEDRGQVIPLIHMDYILETIQYFTNVMGLEVLGVEYLPTAREIHLKTKLNLVLWISIERDYKEQIDKLNTIYEAAELNKEDLSYIDLRIREKVIYCVRNARCDK